MISHQSPSALLARAVRGLAATTLIVVAAGCGSSSDSNTFPTLPDVELTDTDGATVSSSDFVGEPLVINFWYSTCAPCAKELSDFADVDAEVGDEVRFVGINPLDDPDTMVAFAAERGVDYDLFRDEVAEFQTELEITSFPATLFVDPDGRILETTGVLDAEELRGHVADLLSGDATDGDEAATAETEKA